MIPSSRLLNLNGKYNVNLCMCKKDAIQSDMLIRGIGLGEPRCW